MQCKVTNLTLKAAGKIRHVVRKDYYFSPDYYPENFKNFIKIAPDYHAGAVVV